MLRSSIQSFLFDIAFPYSRESTTPLLAWINATTIPFRSIAHAYLRLATVTRESRQAASGLLDHSSKLGAKTQGDILYRTQFPGYLLSKPPEQQVPPALLACLFCPRFHIYLANLLI